MSTGRGRATRALISWAQPSPCRARMMGREDGRAREGGRGSGPRTNGLNSVQGPRTRAPFPPPPVPTPASFLHFRFRPATQARPTHNQSRAGLVEPQFRHERASSGHVATFLRANRAARSTPGHKPHPPRGSEWLSPGGAGERETANGRREAGSGLKRGGGSEKKLQGRRGRGRRRPRACSRRFRPGSRSLRGRDYRSSREGPSAGSSDPEAVRNTSFPPCLALPSVVVCRSLVALVTLCVPIQFI